SARGGANPAGVGVGDDLAFQARSGGGVVIGLQGVAPVVPDAVGHPVHGAARVRVAERRILHGVTRVRVGNADGAAAAAGVGVVVPAAPDGGAGVGVVAVAGRLGVVWGLRLRQAAGEQHAGQQGGVPAKTVHGASFYVHQARRWTRPSTG